MDACRYINFLFLEDVLQINTPERQFLCIYLFCFIIIILYLKADLLVG